MSFDQDSLYTIEAHCTQESPPRCRAACPFNLDVRAFMDKMAEGQPEQARRVLERSIPLTGILAAICDHPCENVCLRQDLGGSLAVHRLEHFCAATVDRQSKVLPIPAKKFSLAVLGAGLAGLTVACDLSGKGYPVTVFHQGTPRQALLSAYPSLRDASCLVDAEWALLERRRVVFSEAALDAALLVRCESGFDAVLVDAGATGGLAPPRDALDARTLHWRDAVCCAGWPGVTPTGHACISASAQAGQGRRAGQTLERLLGKVSLTASREKTQGPLHVCLDGIAPLARVVPEGDMFTDDEAAREAGRCLRCECLICVKKCVFLQKYREYPRVYARQIYNNASIVQGLHTANALINGCALCGQCEEVCPENFSMAEMCLAAREDMVRRNYMPQSAHEFALEDMESASGPECALTLPGVPPGRFPSWLFFPGCQLAASRGEQVAALYAHLRAVMPAPEGGIMLSCCGIPARWAGRGNMFSEHTAKIKEQWEALNKPRILAACSSCLAALRPALPEAVIVSVWEALAGLPLPQPAGPEREVSLPELFSIHDPCTARHDAAWLGAVRSLAEKCGARFEEPDDTGATTPCCGYGGLVSCAQPDLARMMSEHRAARLPHPGLASCIMCRDRLAASGKECWHLLDLLFPGLAAESGMTKGPGLSVRRANRAALKQRLQCDCLGMPLPQAAPDSLRVSPELLASLEERHILLSDMEAAVSAVEKSGDYFENLENGRRLGSWRPRRVTFWVEYSRCDAAFVLHDAWCHRMRVPGTAGYGEGA
jgi:Fe-S oxidoreductase